jgi:quinol monooxygenase YgiN
MFCINVFLSVKDSTNVETIRGLLAECGRQSRAEPGCVSFDVCHVKESPETFILCERWESEQAWMDHKEREAVQTIYLPKVLPLVDRTPYICEIVD